MEYLDLIFNLSLLVAISIVSGFIENRWSRKTRLGKWLQGLLFGGAAVIGMLRPLNFGEGLIFDGRSIMVSLCALFFGPGSATVAGAMAIACRLWLGGMGAITGSLVIVSSAGIGLLAYFRYKPDATPPSVPRLYLFGMVVHIVMLLLMFTLPADAGPAVIRRMGLPVILLYPLATILAGKILADQFQAQRMMASLLESEERLNEALLRQQEAVRAGNVGLWDWDLETNKVHYSAQWKSQIGYEEHEITDDFAEWRSRVHPDDLGPTLKKVNESIAEKRSKHKVEFRFRHKDGSYRWILAQASILQDENGRPLRMLGSHIDISDRKQAEETLRKKDAMLANIASQVPGMLYQFMMKPDGTYSVPYSSKGVKDIFGCSPEDVRDDFEPIFSVIHPEDQNEILRTIEESKENLSQWKCEYRVQVPDKPVRWIFGNSIPEKMADGSIIWSGYNVDITDRKRAEGELRESKALLDTAARTALFGGWSVDLSENRIIWSDQVSEIHEMPPGYSPTVDEGINFYAPEFREKISKVYDECVRLGIPYDEEMQILTSEGNRVWVRATGEAVRNESGVIIGARGSFQDITKRKRAEIELKRTLDATTEGIWSWNFKTNELFFSPRYYTMLGYAPNEFPATYENWINLIHPDDRDGVLSFGEEFLRTKPDVYETEFRLRTKNGDYRWIKSRGRVVERNENGEVVYIIGNHEDITERKQTEYALRKGEEKYRLLVENINDVVFSLDKKGIVTYISPVIETVLGYSPDELLGKNAMEFIHVDDQARSAERFKERNISGNTNPERYRLMGKLGEVHWANVSSRPLYDNGDVVGVQGILTDITESIRMEDHLRNAQKMEAIATLTGGIAHDYNNLLSIIVGNLGLAQRDAKPGSDQADFLNEAENAAHKAGELTHELMAFSKGGEPIKELGSIRGSLKHAANQVPAESDIVIEEDIPEDLWLVPHDPRKMGAVFRNVVQNAVEALPDGGRITIRAQNLRVEDGDAILGLSVKPGDYVLISVQDTGRGILEEDLGKIFDPYFSTKSMGVQKGMGLSLATAHAIVQKHGGDITVRSTPAEGTTVTIYLPAQPEEDIGEDVKEGVSSRQSSTAEDQLSMGRILLMDDEEMLRKLAQQMLKRLGYKVETVKDGLEAIEMYRQRFDSDEPFDAVILDLTIKGGMGGERTLQELLKVDPQIKAIVSSGYSNDPVMSNFQDYGFKAAMAKPYEMKDMEEAIEKALL